LSRIVLRKTKIVATIGPASDSSETIRAMIEAGLDVARLNFSHGTHEEHHQRIQNLRAAAGDVGRELAIMLDTRGPEIRTRRVLEGKADLVAGGEFHLYPQDRVGDASGVSVSHPTFFDYMEEGARILIDDGALELVATRIEDDKVVCRIVRGGRLGDRKGINVPDLRLPHQELTDQDRRDIEFAIRNGVDYIAASFVTSAEDVLSIRRLLGDGGAPIPIIAKIESREGVENLDSILRVADGTMVARGDLGVEVPLQEIPIIQKRIIHATVQNGRPVITATQMLDSMERKPTPTRAEVSDVANAIFDGTSAVMLSGETANGAHPVESVRTMASLALSAEGSLGEYGNLQKSYVEPEDRVTDAVSHAAITMAARLNATAIVTLTESGFTSRSIAKFRPHCPILAVTPSREVVRRLCMNWGVTGMHHPGGGSDDEMLRFGIDRARALGYVAPGDVIVVTHGVEREARSTSMLRVLILPEG